ncbi:glycoside hydrolase family 25 protein [Wolbachia endosymbiont of Anurida maritima]|uniref:glycoside hydrolase family 25 protein n=1 Tax=Wolbachia endosymbiont of Anurida maritima TaxID=2850562 RepID=UPI0035D0E300
MKKTGIEISHYEGKIDGKKVSQDSQEIKFSAIKATEGATFQDSEFQHHFKELRDNKIEAIPYHVFRMTSTPEDQANNFINTLSSVGFDSKDKFVISATTGICAEGKTEKCDNPVAHTNEERAKNLHSLITILKEKGYENVIIYCSPNHWDKYFTQEKLNFSEYHLWDAHWTTDKEPKVPKDWKDAEKSYDYWTYTPNGVVDGITIEPHSKEGVPMARMQWL